MSNKLDASVSCVIEDDNHCSEDCGWICKPDMWSNDYPFHYCGFSNSRGSKMLRSQGCKAVFGIRPVDNEKTKRKRRSKAEMEASNGK